MALSVPSNTVHLRLVQPASVDPARAGALLDDGADWLGSEVESPHQGARRYLTDLTLPVRDRAPHMVFKKAAFVDVGPGRRTESGYAVDVSWRSSSLAPLFPVFAGHLAVDASSIALEGYYAPPGGEVGLVLDRAFLNIAARGTARWFLGRVTAVLAEAAAAEPDGAPVDDSAPEETPADRTEIRTRPAEQA